MKTFAGLVLSALILAVGIVFVRYDARYGTAVREAERRKFVDCESERVADPDPVRLRYYLVRRDEAWAVRIANADAPMSVFVDKADAVRFGEDVARTTCPSQLFIQRADGRFEEGRLYGGEREDAE